MPVPPMLAACSADFQRRIRLKARWESGVTRLVRYVLVRPEKVTTGQKLSRHIDDPYGDRRHNSQCDGFLSDCRAKISHIRGLVLGFKSLFLHQSVSRFQDSAENLPKTGRARDLRLRRARFTVHCAGIARFVFRRDLPRSESRQGQCGTNAEIAARFALDRIWPYRRKHCGIIAVEPRLTMLAELRSMRRLGFLFSELNRYLADIPGPNDTFTHRGLSRWFTILLLPQCELDELWCS